jgi:DNA-binding NarL/FixJ family response regulator
MELAVTVPIRNESGDIAPLVRGLDVGWHRRGRVVICHDNRLLAESLATALAHRGWTIEGIGTTEAAALQQVALYTPDICVISEVISCGSGMAVAGAIERTAPHTRAVVMCTVLDQAARADSRSAGIAALISEQHPISAVDDLLGRIVCGEAVADAGTVVQLHRRAPDRRVAQGTERRPPLTSREREVLALLADGQSTTAMADAMGVSAATIRSHIQSIFTKFGVHTRLRAVAVYRDSVTAAEARVV